MVWWVRTLGLVRGAVGATAGVMTLDPGAATQAAAGMARPGVWRSEYGARAVVGDAPLVDAAVGVGAASASDSTMLAAVGVGVEAATAEGVGAPSAFVGVAGTSMPLAAGEGA